MTDDLRLPREGGEPRSEAGAEGPPQGGDEGTRDQGLPVRARRAEPPARRGESAEPGLGYHGSGAPPHDDTIDLAEVLAILKRNAWIVILATLVGTGVAWFLAQGQTPEYRATAMIRIEDPGQQLSGQLSMLDRTAARVDPIVSAMEMLRSQSVLTEIVQREGLRLVPVNPDGPHLPLWGVQVPATVRGDTLTVTVEAGRFTARLQSGARAEGPLGTMREVDGILLGVGTGPGQAGDAAAFPSGTRTVYTLIALDQAARRVGGGLSSRRRPETNVVDVEYRDSDADRARRVVNQAVQVFRERSMEEARAASVRRRVFLEAQLAQADTLLRENQDALSNFRSTNQVFSPGQRATAQESGLMGVELRREELRADRQSFSQLLERFEAAEGATDASNRLQVLAASPQVAGNPIVATLFQDLLRYESERSALTSGPWALTDRNPDVVRLDQQVAIVSGRLRAAIASQLEVIDTRLLALDDLRNRAAGQIAGIPETEAEESRLLQQVAGVQRTVEQLREEYYRAQMAEAVEGGPVEVVDLALVASRVQRAGLPVMLVLGMMLGFMVGGGAAFVREMLNTSVRRREEVEASIRAPMVGVIPKIQGAGGRLRKGAGGRSSGRELVTVHSTKTAQAEAFRTLRTNLLFAQEFDPVRLLVVTSAMPGEGKTTTAANLAVTYAQQGLRVLLVDCDLRKPRLDDVFQLPRKPGLTEMALGDASGSEAIRPFEAVPNLFILTAGNLPDTPSELLGGKRMSQLLRLLKPRFDAVILDTSPLSGGADAAILGAQADGVLVVVRAGTTEREAVNAASRQLHSVGARVLGCVMNDPEGEVPRYGHYYENSYYGAPR